MYRILKENLLCQILLNSLNARVEELQGSVTTENILTNGIRVALYLGEEDIAFARTITETINGVDGQYIFTDINDIEKEIDLINAQANNIKLQIENIKKEHIAQISEKYQSYIEERSKYNNRLKRYKDKLLRKVIKSPITGIIQEINFFTQGGVVKPGEEIMSIVPQDEQLIVEAKLPVSDIGYVNLSQDVLVRLQGNEGFAYAPINGKISFISPDTKPDDEGKSFYVIHVKTDAKEFYNKQNNYLLYPGLIVDCNN